MGNRKLASKFILFIFANMSKVNIQQYYSKLAKAIQFGKSKNEASIRNYFWILLNDYARKLHYEVVPELRVKGIKGRDVQPDGVVKNNYYLDIGLWESKDEKTNLDDEIAEKIKKGYPLTNILFEDSATAVLYQRDIEVMRVDMHDANKLDEILKLFFGFKNEFIFKFEAALEKFKEDIPQLVDTLRGRIENAGDTNEIFRRDSHKFLELCRAEINPDITEADIREMMIQHILTSDIFNKIFDDSDFHRHNNIASELEALINVLFSYSDRKNLLASIEHYYDAMNTAAAGISDHHEKQKFLKLIYENFYKVYNPKAADRLGVVYTPNEIVQFMIESTDYLLHKHFGKTLADRNVEILDPATGTGTFITSIIDYIPNQNLLNKYKDEIHANEVAILPYYIANLNIEYTYKQKMGQYEEFKNLCFVDTLDNTTALSYGGKQHQLFGLSSENAERIKRQNAKKISVVIGNPPYNANQLNENENNKNREYRDIDKRIKDTYIKHSTAQKTKVYDMYARFYRWSMDRLDKNGVLAFVTNRSFIDSRTFDGFRKCIQEEFSHAYIIDTKSDVRANPKIAGTTHNVFGIQTGVAIMFLIKKDTNLSDPCRISYIAMEDEWRKEEKLEWLASQKIEELPFNNITPDKNNNWINLAEDNDWESLLSIKSLEYQSLFNLTSNGIVTARDEWVYDFNEKNLNLKIKYFLDKLNSQVKSRLIDNSDLDYSIKWSASLKTFLKKGKSVKFSNKLIRKSFYKPYVIPYYYSEKILSDRLTSKHLEIFGKDLDLENKVLLINNGSTIFKTCVTNHLYEFGSMLEGGGQTIGLPLYRYTQSGERIDNITDWGLEQFRLHYGNGIGERLVSKKQESSHSVEQNTNTYLTGEYPQPHLEDNERMLLHEPEAKYGNDRIIEKEDVFHYVYAVLHHPAYRQKYELNLKRDFPRIPFYDNFWQWASWGEELMNLHIEHESMDPYPLERHDIEKTDASKPKAKLKANKEEGIIEIDELTTLSRIPKEAWEYKLGNRSALEWVLDQYKEKKPSDPTIAELFDTYKFSDYKEQVIDLIRRVCSVSIDTMKIMNAMP